MRKSFFVLSFLLTSGLLMAQKEDSVFIRAISDDILNNGKAYEYLRQLTKQVGGRVSGSPNMVKAENWGLKTMQDIGADKAWLQECMVPHWVRAGKDVVKAMARGGSRDLDALALGNSEGTGGKYLTAPVMMVGSFEELEKRKEEAKGKIVFFNYKFRNELVQTFQAYSDAVKYRGGAANAGSKNGAVGVLVRSMTHAVGNNPHTGAMRYDSAIQKIPAIAIGIEDADWMSQEISKGTITVSLSSNAHMLPDTIGHNVIAELTGSEFPNEVITIGGHLDSWDPGEGAHDDGAGCVQSLEILRVFRALGYKPKHTIRIVLFANEENGGRGGDKYAEVAQAKGEKHIFALESDAGGFTPRGFGLTAPDDMFAKFMSWQPLIAPYGASDFRKGGGGSDISPLGKTFATPLAGLSPDSQRYFDIHHARSDVFENVNKRELLLGAVNMAALVYLVDKYGM
ncbi:MAG: M20/M25/M40 family metallo-hydrolase [Chitinophagaceae bacterium]|nr:M20/M25/M40 family metallo-hydrolase [Chitinophagaceae bacterium]